MVTKKASSKKKTTKKSIAKKSTTKKSTTKKTTTKSTKRKTSNNNSSNSYSAKYSKNSSKKIHNEMLTIMFVDIVNYTKTTTKLSRELFNDMHEVFDILVGDSVDKYNGTIIKKIGDAFLITFKVATDAVHCGIAMQKKFKEYNDRYDLPMPLEIRVAIHAGDVMVKNNDIYGDAVNVTSRLEGLAKPRTVVFSEVVYSSMNKGEIEYEFIGNKKVKGVERPIRVFKAKTQEDIDKEERLRIRRHKLRNAKKIQRILSGAIIIVLVAIVAFLLIIYFNQLMSLF